MVSHPPPYHTLHRIHPSPYPPPSISTSHRIHTQLPSTNRFCTAARAAEIEAFFATHPLPSSARRISQSVEMIRSAGAMVERIRGSGLVQAGYW